MGKINAHEAHGFSELSGNERRRRSMPFLLYAGCMPSLKTELRVRVVDDEIIVTRPGYFYSVTYYKPEGSPQLVAKRMSDRDDLRIPMKLSDFLAQAWRLANDRARELGWIH